jgi:hypothetical protein
MGLIDKFGANYTVTRFLPGTYTKGKWVGGGTSSTFTVVASVQPLKAFEAMAQPEGFRSREMIRIYTKTALQATREDQAVRGDQIVYKGRTYEIMRVEQWDWSYENAMPHFKVIGALIESSAR